MQKISNAIVIGGPISVGKTSIVNLLPFVAIHELDPNDELQNILLEQMYKGDEVASQVFQLDILLTRFDKYKEFANSEKPHVFDRSILEDKIFAYLQLKNNKNVWNYYESIFNDRLNEMINEIGVPRIYIHLSLNWETFKKRTFKRNRISEVQNFEKNEKYFKKIIEIYDDYMIKKYKKYNIPYYLIDTNDKGIEEVEKIIRLKLKEVGVL